MGFFNFRPRRGSFIGEGRFNNKKKFKKDMGERTPIIEGEDDKEGAKVGYDEGSESDGHVPIW